MDYLATLSIGFLVGFMAQWLDTRCEVRRLERMAAKAIARAAEAEADRDGHKANNVIVGKIYTHHLDTHHCVKIEAEEEWPEIVGG